MKSHKKEKSSVAVSVSRNVLSAHKQTDLHILRSTAWVGLKARGKLQAKYKIVSGIAGRNQIKKN